MNTYFNYIKTDDIRKRKMCVCEMATTTFSYFTLNLTYVHTINKYILRNDMQAY